MAEIIDDKILSKSTIVKFAGFAYLIIIVIGVLNAVFIDSRLISNEDIYLTINNISANELLFRFGSTCVLILYVLVIVLSVLLYLILKTVNKNLAFLAMIFRLGEALLGITTVIFSFMILSLLNNKSDQIIIENVQLNILIASLLDARTAGLYIVLLLVGIGGTLFFFLFYKSFFIPKILSVWGMFTYLSMLILSFIGILFPEHPDSIEIVLYGLGSLFELSIGFWFLIKGVNIKQMKDDIEI